MTTETTTLADRLSLLGYRFEGRLDLHPETVIEGPTWLLGGLDNDQPAHIGAFTYSHSLISTSVRRIGRYCSIAHSVVLGELEHPTDWLSTSSFVYDANFMWGEHLARRHSDFRATQRDLSLARASIDIGNDVWIGAGAYIRSGVSIGDGAIIGARAVVTRDVPPFAVVVGNPGRVVKHRFHADIIAKALSVRWWDYDFSDLGGIDVRCIDSALDDVARRRAEGALFPYEAVQIPFVQLALSL